LHCVPYSRLNSQPTWEAFTFLTASACTSLPRTFFAFWLFSCIYQDEAFLSREFYLLQIFPSFPSLLIEAGGFTPPPTPPPPPPIVLLLPADMFFFFCLDCSQTFPSPFPPPAVGKLGFFFSGLRYAGVCFRPVMSDRKVGPPFTRNCPPYFSNQKLSGFGFPALFPCPGPDLIDYPFFSSALICLIRNWSVAATVSCYCFLRPFQDIISPYS